MRILLQIIMILAIWACSQIPPYATTIKNKKADIGVAVADEKSYWENSTRAYPLMSVFKLHIAVAIMDKVNKNELALNQTIKITTKELDSNTWTPMLKKYPQTGFDIKLKTLLYYMLAESDNNACDILIDRAGGISSVEQYIHSIGLKNTTLKVTEAQMQEDDMLQYQNTATLQDLILLLKKINNNELFVPELHKELINIMQQTNTGENKIKKYLPQTVKVAHKTGSSSRLHSGKKIADNDVAILKKGDKSIYIVIMIADSLETDDDNAEIIAQIAKNISQKHLP
ncbi:MAG: class A beta-lactamase [Acetobacter sp.]|nr:class A beta-lactamase [Acetobacter sp.]